MASRIQYNTTKEGTLITIGNNLTMRVKGLFIIQFLVAIIGAVSFLMMFYNDLDTFASTGLLLFTLTSATVFFVAAYRYLNRVLEREEILVKSLQLIITDIGFLKRKVRVFEIAKVADFHHLAAPKYTDHPLNGKSFDYLGFQTRDKEIQAINNDGRISFFYEGRNILFGKGITTWEAEEIGKVIYEITKNDIRFDDLYEKEILMDEGN
jgi:hypothetical protein